MVVAAAAIAPLVLQLVTSIVASAPVIADGIAKAKKVLEALFSAGVIDKTTQDSQMAYVDSLGLIAAAGVPPSSWQVKPDPIV